MTETNNNQTSNASGNIVDDRGTNQRSGREILKRLRDVGFEANDEKFAVALGRPVEEVAGWMSGKEPIDDDILMKARGIAKERNLTIE
jgi:hypothetical protein